MRKGMAIASLGVFIVVNKLFWDLTTMEIQDVIAWAAGITMSIMYACWFTVEIVRHHKRKKFMEEMMIRERRWRCFRNIDISGRYEFVEVPVGDLTEIKWKEKNDWNELCG